MLRSCIIVALRCVCFAAVAGATYKKCCAEYEGLVHSASSSSAFECNSAFHEDVLPLRTVGNTSGPPGEKECVDKLVNEVNAQPLLVKKPGFNATVALLPTIHKCCPDRMRLNVTTWSCSVDGEALTSLLWDTEARLYNLIYGSPHCKRAFEHHLLEDVDDFSISNGALNISLRNEGQNYFFDNGTYCIDATNGRKTVSVFACRHLTEGLRTVCKTHVCVPKCCAPGFSYLRKNGKIRCAPSWNVTFQPPFILGNESVDPENIVLLPGPVCSKYMSTKHILLANGTLRSQKHFYEPFANKFCMEHFTTANITFTYVICIDSPAPELKHFYYLAGLIVSIIFLGITLTTYFFLPELQNLHGRTVMSHTTSLLAAYICLAFVKVPVAKYAANTCRILGYGILYTFLSAFFWLNVMCFDIWRTFGVVQARGFAKKNEVKKFLLYCVYAHGLPLVITAVALFVDLYEDIPLVYKPKIGYTSCWFDLSKGPPLEYTIFFITPVGALIGCNVVLFALTLRNCLKIRREIQRMQQVDSKKKLLFLADKATLLMNLKLFVVMGITWIFELISSYVRQPEALWMVFDAMNVLQGLWIFCIFVLKDNVWKALKKKLGYKEVRDTSQTRTTSLSAKMSNASIKLNEIVVEERNLLQNNSSVGDKRK